MTTPPNRDVRSAAVPLLRVALSVQALRLLIAVIGGIAASFQHAPGGGFGIRTVESGAQRLELFASAGDELGVALMLIVVVLLWATAGRAGSAAWPSNYAATTSLLVLTGVSSVLSAVSYLWLAGDTGFFPIGEEIRVVGFPLASAAAMAGALYVVRGIHDMRGRSDDAAATGDIGGEEGAAVFAVDRKTGAVLAWPSVQEARQKAPLYGVEDDEYDWYLDDGVVVAAAAVGGEVQLTPTPEARPDELLRDLAAHAERRGLVIDEPDEPLAYVDPIAKDNYLEMWPGWLRWIGRLVR